ncbi:hypothetical protein RRG08_063688 [Elysia crispata]|uniref:Uncharacterized protein n=1 Tax=Elysia crispata TaxID=231223 RepID=A0AAE0ZB36_9GAST|nr:hypothetical protein RRG08_063688 [Elysia crispata]
MHQTVNTELLYSGVPGAGCPCVLMTSSEMFLRFEQNRCQGPGCGDYTHMLGGESNSSSRAEIDGTPSCETQQWQRDKPDFFRG